MDYEGYRDYHNTQLQAETVAASPYRLVLVLMDGLLDELFRAKGHIAEKRFAQKGQSINKCIGMLNGLSSMLDFEQGGEVVINLARIYDYCTHRLYDASIELEVAHIDEVLRLLTTIRGGWAGVLEARGG